MLYLEQANSRTLCEYWAVLPTPDDILNLRPIPELTARVRKLLKKNCDGGLTNEEEAEWQRIEMIEHVMRIAKAHAAKKVRE